MSALGFHRGPKLAFCALILLYARAQEGELLVRFRELAVSVDSALKDKYVLRGLHLRSIGCLGYLGNYLAKFVLVLSFVFRGLIGLHLVCGASWWVRLFSIDLFGLNLLARANLRLIASLRVLVWLIVIIKAVRAFLLVFRIVKWQINVLLLWIVERDFLRLEEFRNFRLPHKSALQVFVLECLSCPVGPDILVHHQPEIWVLILKLKA
jgi:hypothetical protein